jgi:hypothetical protein
MLPNATEEDPNGLGPSEGCNDQDSGVYRCWFEDVVDGHWVNIRAFRVGGNDPRSTIAPLFNAMQAAIEDAPKRPFTWEQPAETLPMPERCELIESDALTEIFGTTTPLAPGRNMGGWSLEALSWARLGAMPCQLLFTGADVGVGTITWLPGATGRSPRRPAMPNPSRQRARGRRSGDRRLRADAQRGDLRRRSGGRPQLGARHDA